MHILNGDRAFRLTLLDLLAQKGRKRLSFDRVFELALTPAPLLQQWGAWTPTALLQKESRPGFVRRAIWVTKQTRRMLKVL